MISYPLWWTDACDDKVDMDMSVLPGLKRTTNSNSNLMTSQRSTVRPSGAKIPDCA